jgi:hypothetical protein
VPGDDTGEPPLVEVVTAGPGGEWGGAADVLSEYGPAALPEAAAGDEPPAVPELPPVGLEAAGATAGSAGAAGEGSVATGA